MPLALGRQDMGPLVHCIATLCLHFISARNQTFLGQFQKWPFPFPIWVIITYSIGNSKMGERLFFRLNYE
jgi:hypothetical protein